MFLCAFATLCVTSVARATAPAQVGDVRLWSGPEGTRLVVDLSAPVRHQVFTIDNPDRVVIDLENTRLAMRKALPGGQGQVRTVRSGPQAGGGLRIVLDLEAALRGAYAEDIGPVIEQFFREHTVEVFI
jgi:N-acetylmuramoyl-L-alanine amidase